LKIDDYQLILFMIESRGQLYARRVGSLHSAGKAGRHGPARAGGPPGQLAELPGAGGLASV